MADHYVLAVSGIEALRFLDDLPPRMIQAAQRAVNDAARSGRTMLDREIRDQVAFPAGYLAPSQKRLVVEEFATKSNLQATISARARPTSLARFTKDNPSVGGARRKAGVRVEVAPGSVKRLDGAFLIRLRAGTAALETKNNLGLAVRTKNGRPPPGYKPARLSENLWLLYGPSVAQVMFSERNQGGAATDVSPDIAQRLEDEFWRQMGLD
jgi:hypothetical protein